MKNLPDVVIVIDVCHDENAVKEANKLHIPVVAIVDTNSDPEPIDYPVAANDDAVKSIKVIMDTFVEAIKDASELYGAKVAEQRAKEEAAKAERAEKAKAAGEDKKAAKADRPFTKRAPRKDGEKKPAAKKTVVKKDLADLKKSDVAEAKAE
jgi:small subunit ribosomal protein S2